MKNTVARRVGKRVGAAFGVLLGVVFCAPLVPVAVSARAFRRRRKYGPPHRRRLRFMTRPGRLVFLLILFFGSELVAIDMFASNYFNAVDEHAASILGIMLIAVLVLVIVADLLIRGAYAVVRGVAGGR